MSYDNLIKNISNYISQELGLSDVKQDKIRFGLEIVVSQLISLSAVMCISYVLGILNYVIIILLVTATLRITGGGIHFKTVYECTFFTSIFTIVSAYLAVNLSNSNLLNRPYFLVIISVFIILFLYLWSPAKVENKPFKDECSRKKYKFISTLIGVFWLIFILTSYILFQQRYYILISSTISGLLLQLFSISPLAYIFNNRYYHLKEKYWLNK
ncbi:MAG: accessory gene regulator ArgB-like protein [Halanaerobiaceae bacterium]